MDWRTSRATILTVVGVGSSLGKAIGLSHSVELLEPASLEDTDSSAVEVCITLNIRLAKMPTTQYNRRLRNLHGRKKRRLRTCCVC